MKQAIFQWKNLVINYFPGEFFTRETLPKKSIALDGILVGSYLDSIDEKISFDHHSPALPRHSQAATCKQVFDAVMLGWKFPTRDGKIWIYLNDIDLDSMLSLFLLSLNKTELNSRIEQWVNITSSSDMFGPAYIPNESKFIKIRDFLYYRILRKHRGKTTSEIIGSILENFLYYSSKPQLQYSFEKAKAKNLFIIERSLFIHPSNTNQELYLLAILSEDPVFDEAYLQGADLVLAIRRKVVSPNQMKYKYSLAKKHDWIGFDLLSVLTRISERESGWGGASSIIGSPEAGSDIQPQQLLTLIKSGTWKD